jgi:uncharacterized protein
MRIVAAADIHGVMSVYEWIVRLAQDQRADLLILAGDLLQGGSEDDQRRQGQHLVALLKVMPIPVFYIMGNDDFVPLDYEDEQFRSLHAKQILSGGYSFVGYQYSPPFVGGIFEKPEIEIAEDARRLEPLLDEHTIFVSHSPAFGILDRVASGARVGSRSLAALLRRKPVLAHIHGHIHESFGREGKHFNVAAAGMRRTYCLDLPSLNHRMYEDMLPGEIR